MRRELLWALAVCILLSGWALLHPATRSVSTGVVPPAARVATGSGSSSPEKLPFATNQSSSAAAVFLPATWPKPAMEMATRSPFSSPTLPTPKAVVNAPTAPPPRLPQPPQVGYRLWGSLSTPSGNRVLYLARDDNQGQPISVQVGTRLDGGFVVEQVSVGAIVLAQTETQRRVTLSLSPPPSNGVH